MIRKILYRLWPKPQTNCRKCDKKYSEIVRETLKKCYVKFQHLSNLALEFPHNSAIASNIVNVLSEQRNCARIHYIKKRSLKSYGYFHTLQKYRTCIAFCRLNKHCQKCIDKGPTALIQHLYK